MIIWKELWKKYKITKDYITIIDNAYEYSYKLTLREDIYNEFNKALTQ